MRIFRAPRGHLIYGDAAPVALASERSMACLDVQSSSTTCSTSSRGYPLRGLCCVLTGSRRARQQCSRISSHSSLQAARGLERGFAISGVKSTKTIGKDRRLTGTAPFAPHTSRQKSFQVPREITNTKVVERQPHGNGKRVALQPTP
ncbi:hypothetical protein ON010_g913 [Phytophthora cinnamomi]|nr:hypothetical protein ON010_g913 [Phytophthora cinnamomi]